MPVRRAAFDERIFTVAIYDSNNPRNRVDTIDLNPEVTTLTWSTAIPGGFQALTVGYDHYALGSDGSQWRFSTLPRYAIAPQFGIVHVHARQHLAFEGRIVRNDYGAEGVLSFQAKGLGIGSTNDKPFVGADDGIDYTSGQILQQVLAQCCPLLHIDFDNWQDPGVKHRRVEFNRRFASQIIDQITREGNTAGNSITFNVWESQVAEQPGATAPAQLLPITAPTVPTYKISWGPDITSWVEIGEEAYNNVAVQYTDADTGATDQLTQYYRDGVFADIYGFERYIIIDGGTLDVAGANAYAQTYLAAHKQPTVQCTIQRTGFRGLELAGGGAEYPPYLVRAGEWIQIANFPFQLPIVRTEYNASTGELSLEIGATAPSYASLIHELHRAHCATAAGSNLNTGAPA